jgi:hypothetical protein
MRESGIVYKDRTLKGPLGVATIDCVFINLKRIKDFHPAILFFIILHETAHHKRIQKMGKEKVINMLSNEDFDAFCEHVIYEERVADRYACMVYGKMNGFEFPKAATQRLDEPERQQMYRSTASVLFGKIKNSEEEYNKLLNSFVDEQ